MGPSSIVANQMDYAILRLREITPGLIKSMLKVLGIGKLISLFWNNYTAELAYQKGLVIELRDNKSKILEYWQKYLYLDEIKTICQIKDNTKVLDVGCGITTVLHFINGERYGIDPLADKYRQLYSYPGGIDIRKGLGEEIPFPDEFFDIVFCSSALDHVTDPQKTIGETYRVLKPRGYVVLSVEIFEKKTRSSHSLHSLTKRDVYSILDGKLRTIFERESPRVGLGPYISGSRKSRNKELIMILKKS
jgi:SAM-dependent methyltransferase